MKYEAFSNKQVKCTSIQYFTRICIWDLLEIDEAILTVLPFLSTVF